MVREFHRVIGDEAREQCRALTGRRPRRGRRPASAVDRTPSGCSPASSTPTPGWSGVEPAGGAAVGRGVPGVVHGMRSFLMQDEYGQVEEAQSISAGLDYPGVGPEHAYLALDRAGRVPGGHRRRGARRVHLPGPHRGDHRRLRVGPRRRLGDPRGRRAPRAAPSWSTCRVAATRTSPRRWTLLGMTDVAGRTPDRSPRGALRAARDAGHKLLVPYITGGYPGWEDAVRAAAANGADGVEIGIPFSDPVMDGPVIQQASQAALEAGATPLSILDAVATLDVDDPAGRDDVLQHRPPRRSPTLRRPTRRRRRQRVHRARPAARGGRAVVRGRRRRRRRDDHARRADRARRAAPARRRPHPGVRVLGRAARRDR